MLKLPASASRAVKGKGVAACVVLLLASAPLATRAWSVAFAERWATQIAAGVLSVSALLPRAPALDEPALDEPAAEEPDGPAFDATLSDRPANAGGLTSGKAGRGGARVAVHGVRISAAQVLALAARRAMPGAVPVPATTRHPAGLMLSGVSALGVGLQDGDVLTEAAGQKATSVAAVVGIVLAARGRQVPEISGRFYRGWVPFALSVEQPYPESRSRPPVPG